MIFHPLFLTVLLILEAKKTSGQPVASGVTLAPNHQRRALMHPSDPYIVLLKDNATMNATEHAQWSTDTHNKLQNERNLRGVGRIFDLPDLQAYTGSFTPEMADIIENHPDVRAMHDDADVWLAETGQEGRVDNKCVVDP